MPDPNTYLSRIPELEDGRRFPSLAPDQATKLCDELLTAGRDDILALIDTLKEVDDGSDWKTRFVLKALASHSQGADRKKLQDIYGAALSSDRPAPIKTFLTMQLHWIADRDAIAVLVRQLNSDDPALIDAAAAALTAIGKPAEKPLKQAAKSATDHAKTAVDHALKQIG